MAAAEFELNGQSLSVNDVDPHCTLLDWLRATGRTGSKEGCAEGECGACAVAFFSRDAEGRPCLVSVNSCLVAFPEVHGRALVSVEGVNGGGSTLHPVQEAMVGRGGSQCGYCTPGFVVSLFCEYYRPGRCHSAAHGQSAAHASNGAEPRASGIDREAISGNLCRCTGYRPILAAAEALAAPQPEDPWLARLDAGSGPLPALEYRGGGHRFVRPASAGELGRVLQEEPGAVLIGGGTDLMVYSNQRRTRYAALVSVGALAELRQFEVRETEVVIGAALPLSHLEQRLEASSAGHELSALRQLLPLFSSRLIRNRATLGGNLATASPIGDAAPVLLALGAWLTLASSGGERRLALAEFFLGYRKTALAPGEWIQSVHVPRPAPEVQRFYKVSKRVLDDISTVAAAFALQLRPDKSVARFRAAYGGIAERPLAAHELEQLARDKPWDATTLEQLRAAARSLGTPLSDQRGSAAYRSAMIEKLLERFFFETSWGEAP